MRNRLRKTRVLLLGWVWLTATSAVAQSDGIHLQWDIGSSEQPALFKLYRDTLPGTRVFLSSIDGSARQFVDTQVIPGNVYYYVLTAVDSLGIESEPSNELMVRWDIPTGINDGSQGGPQQFFLEQNYPNPFNPGTTIGYYLPGGAAVEVAVFNVLGQKVRQLDRSFQPAGRHQVQWDGTDESGRPLPSGVYLYRLSAGNLQHSRRMILKR